MVNISGEKIFYSNKIEDDITPMTKRSHTKQCEFVFQTGELAFSIQRMSVMSVVVPEFVLYDIDIAAHICTFSLLRSRGGVLRLWYKKQRFLKKSHIQGLQKLHNVS